MDVIGIIPARYNSSRLPGKPLASIGDKPMVCHVYDRASIAIPDKVWVATDDMRIYDAVVSHGGKAVLVTEECSNGTERCQKAVVKLGLNPDVVINIQGDEPFISPEDIALVISQFENAETEIATLARRFEPQEGFDSLFSADNVKVVMDSSLRALYFSRSIIPYMRDYQWQNWTQQGEFFIHVGLYGFRIGVLNDIVITPISVLEKAERLEQLRWLGAGYKIQMAITDKKHFGIDTLSDYEAACRYYTELNKK